MPPQNDPTRQGASSEPSKDDAAEENKPVLSARDVAMAELIATREGDFDQGEAVTHPDERERHASDTAENADTEDTPDTEGGSDDSKNKLSADPEGKGVDNARENSDDNDSAVATSAPDIADHIYLKDGVPTMKLKVKGEEVEMPVDKVKSIAQKNMLADVRLRNVAATEKDLKRRASQLAERERQQSLAHPPAKPGAEVNEETMKADARSFVDTLFEGTREEATEKAVQYLSSISSTPVDTEALKSDAVKAATAEAQRVLAERDQRTRETAHERSLQQGLVYVESTYPELLLDDVLFDMIDARSDSVAEANPEWSPQQVMTAAAKEVAEKVGLKPRSAGDPPPSPDEDGQTVREDRKRQLQPVPRSTVAGARHERRVEEPVDSSPKAVLERMREQRAGLGGRV